MVIYGYLANTLLKMKHNWDCGDFKQGAPIKNETQLGIVGILNRAYLLKMEHNWGLFVILQQGGDFDKYFIKIWLFAEL